MVVNGVPIGAISRHLLTAGNLSECYREFFPSPPSQAVEELSFNGSSGLRGERCLCAGEPAAVAIDINRREGRSDPKTRFSKA